MTKKLATVVVALALLGCQKSAPVDTTADARGRAAPSAATLKANADFVRDLPLADPQDMADATQGLVASDPALVVKSADGELLWNAADLAFVKGAAPDSVNPSLWRQAQLHNQSGLFKVADGIYQLRGVDVANLSLIEGKTGWIVVDPLTARETAAAGMAFIRKHLGDKPIVAFVFTHSHVDHFGGVFGTMSAEAIREKGVRVIAPKGFMEESTSENILAGTAMARRSQYQFGRYLERGPRGFVSNGLGNGLAYGTIGIVEPTDLIDRTGQELDIDGLRFVFQYAPDSEAPAELSFYLPERKAFCGAEVVSRTLHNVYTLRGAKVRDALKWSGYIDDAARRFGDAEVFFASHNWPMWGNARIREFLKKQRDTYKFIHDQTVRLANAGFTPREIAEQLQLPPSLASTFSNRGYYGTVSHNAKAVYQFYFGWYDANPANLNPLPPEAAAARYVRYMGGAENVLKQAQASYDDGDYRWVAEVLSHLVFADPDNAAAKALLANAHDQLGYQAESAIWRNAYLTAANELRFGASQQPFNVARLEELLRHTPMKEFLTQMAARLKAEDAHDMRMTVNLVFTDSKESYVLELDNAVLNHRAAAPDAAANATLNLTRELFLNLATGKASLRETIMSDDLSVQGSRLDLIRFFALFEQQTGAFNIVTP